LKFLNISSLGGGISATRCLSTIWVQRSQVFFGNQFSFFDLLLLRVRHHSKREKRRCQQKRCNYLLLTALKNILMLKVSGFFLNVKHFQKNAVVVVRGIHTSAFMMMTRFTGPDSD
jgi:hypothetical protein